MAMMVGYMEAKSTSATRVWRPMGGMKERPPLSMVSSSPAVLKCSGSALRQGMRMPSASGPGQLHGGDQGPGAGPGRLLEGHLADPGDLDQPHEARFPVVEGVAPVQMPAAGKRGPRLPGRRCGRRKNSCGRRPNAPGGRLRLPGPGGGSRQYSRLQRQRVGMITSSPQSLSTRSGSAR